MAESVAGSLAGRVLESLIGVAKKEIGYIWNCTENVEKIRVQLQNLKDMKGRVQQQIDVAKSKGDNLWYGVQEWVDTACVEISKAEEFLEEEAHAKKTCFKFGLCGNWRTFYRYSKRATHMAPFLLQHQVRGTIYESGVSVYTPAPGPLDVYQNKNLDDIITHNSALVDIIAALEDESKQIIGIYGLGGVGKTTLAKEVVARVRSQFDAVAIATVSQSVNVDKIQKDIEKATKRIVKGEKILIILDDVWKTLNLEELCIPCGTKYMNCKILLTSRSEEVCNKMNAQTKICIDPLSIKETWTLFKRVVGERVESDVTLKQVAMKIAKECGGLPLLIQAVGNALKDKGIDSWNSALTRLKKHAPLDIDSDIKNAYNHLKLSYDYLESEEVRSCFLLCSMFPEDEHILLEDLVYYGLGLAKFSDLESMDDARDRVCNAVNILTSCGLLMNKSDKKYTKMHDVVRDVALLIASEGNSKFLVETQKGLTEWLPRKNTAKTYTRISLMKNKICKLPDYELYFPHLDTFLIQANKLSTISNEFIGGMKEARVLDMASNQISSLPRSMKLLTKLCMLNLAENKSLHEISILGELKDLEILILRKTGIKEIPREIGQLANLRQFDVSRCKHLSNVTPGVISKLWRLEDLCIGFCSNYGGIYDTMVEIMNLSKLTYLDLFVPCFDVIPEGFGSRKLKGFVIQIGGVQNSFHAFTLETISNRCLIIATKCLKIPFLKRIKNLIDESPNTVLDSIQNLNNVLPTLYHESFSKLESIRLMECPNVSCLVDTRDWDELQDLCEERKTEETFFTKLKHLHLNDLDRLEVILNCPRHYISLGNLVTLSISRCHKLVRVFSLSVAQGLVSLRELTIKLCYGLEEVISGGVEETAEMSAKSIVLPSLAKISFSYLIGLKSFNSGNFTVIYPSLIEVSIIDCKSLKIWGHGTQDTPELKFVGKVPLDGPHAINDAVAKSHETMKKRRDYEKALNARAPLSQA